ncbi:hypothetical protein L484_018486 [Morus notabilis]|uniref:Uncharacterized protein n=1 Tax=Morus notabilis TaxID=981085 RepID=W9S3H6_9ROSA|nr:hypothetical protein L484_018486 [Morus notabilis]
MLDFESGDCNCEVNERREQRDRDPWMGSLGRWYWLEFAADRSFASGRRARERWCQFGGGVGAGLAAAPVLADLEAADRLYGRRGVFYVVVEGKGKKRCEFGGHICIFIKERG